MWDRPSAQLRDLAIRIAPHRDDGKHTDGADDAARNCKSLTVTMGRDVAKQRMPGPGKGS